MVGAGISLVSFIVLYFLVVYFERTYQRISLGTFALAMAIPFICSVLVGFSSSVLGSAALAGWLAVVTRFVLTYLALWKIVSLPRLRSLSYTAAAVVIDVIFQSIWFFWLVDIVT